MCAGNPSVFSLLHSGHVSGDRRAPVVRFWQQHLVSEPRGSGLWRGESVVSTETGAAVARCDAVRAVDAEARRRHTATRRHGGVVLWVRPQRCVANETRRRAGRDRCVLWVRTGRVGRVGTAGVDRVEALDLVAQIAYVRGGSAGRERGDVGSAREGHGGTVAGLAATSGRWRLQRRRRRGGGRSGAVRRPWRHRRRWTHLL